MLDETIQERNALDGRTLTAVEGRLAITAAPDCARFSLRVREAAREQAGRCVGAALPGKIGGLSRAGERIALCLGPDEWFLLAPSEDADAIVARFRTEMRDTPYSLVDVSHREVGIELQGPAAALALSVACALDLDAMPPESCTRTLFDKATIVLVKHAPDHYRIEVWQSFADHVWGLLDAARREIALGL